MHAVDRNEAVIVEPIVLDPVMRQLYETSRRVAATPLPVLVLGETGSGKEIMAEWLHANSQRTRGRLVRVNCASFTDSLLESELFGHEKGAFTGASSAHAGVVMTADRGTLFLDEVGELSPTAQAKLLRFIESGEFVPVGGTQSRRVDTRIVAATHRDLRALAQRGDFRMDLYFRLNGVTLTLPPLRERRAEIVPLARMFLRRAAERMGRPEPVIHAELEAALVQHPWPGNVRELRNTMERLVAMWDGGTLDVADLAFDRSVLSCAAAAVDDTEKDPIPPALSPSRSIRDEVRSFERDRILAALSQTRGNQTRAARLLGISRRTLTNKLNAHAIDRTCGGDYGWPRLQGAAGRF